jgi:hypothetical protein
MKKPTKKRLVKGKDYDAWAYRHTGKDEMTWRQGEFGHWAESIPDRINKPTSKGKWVKVKFVEVK